MTDPDQLKLFIGRGSDLCLLQSSRVVLPAAPDGPERRLPPVRCPTSVDRATFPASLAVRG